MPMRLSSWASSMFDLGPGALLGGAAGRCASCSFTSSACAEAAPDRNAKIDSARRRSRAFMDQSVVRSLLGEDVETCVGRVVAARELDVRRKRQFLGRLLLHG